MEQAPVPRNPAALTSPETGARRLPITLVLLLGCLSTGPGGCSGCLETSWYNGADGGPDRDGSGNRAPILAPFGTHTVEEGQFLQVVLSVYDPDGDRLVFSAAPLPPGSEFDRQHGVFTWTPPEGASENSPYSIEFIASDGQLETRSTGTVVVEAGPVYVYRLTPDRVRQRGGTLVTAEGIGFKSPAAVTIAGITGSDLTVIDESTLTFISPPLPDSFGPQTLIFTFPNDHRVVMHNSLFVYTDDAELTGSVLRVALPEGTRVWAAGDVDGDLIDEIAVGSDTYAALVDLDDRPVGIDMLIAEGVDSLALGYLDQDGMVDLALQTEAGTVWVVRPARSPEVIPVYSGVNPAIAIGTFDLEGDGDDEILVIDDLGNRLVFPLLSGGVIGAPISSGGLALPRRVQVVDLEGDRSGDLLVELQDGFAIARGVETGVFLSERIVAGSQGYYQPVIEWEGDPIRPAILALGQDRVGKFSQDPSGQWTAALEMAIDPLDSTDHQRYLVDIQGDGSHEVLTLPPELPGFRQDNRVDARFDPGDWTMVGPVLGPPLLADLDGNGLNELLLLDPDRAEAVVIWTRSGGQTLDAPRGVFTGGGLGVLAGDFLSRGYTDLVIAGTQLDGLPVHLLLQGYTAGRFSDESFAIPSHADITQLVLTDLTGDGFVDIVSSGGDGTLYCYPSLGPAVFGTRQEVRWAEDPVQLVELARQGDASRVGVLFSGGAVAVLASEGVCQLVVVQDLATNGVLLTETDPDGDRWSELLVLDGQGFLTLFDAAEDGSYQPEIGVELGMTNLTDMAAGHVTGALAGDLVIVGIGGVALLENALDSGASSNPIWDILDSSGAEQIALGDLNGDGTDEVVVTDGQTPPRVYWRHVDSWEKRVMPSWHLGAWSPILADLDRDSDLDLVTLHPGFGAVIWPNGAAD